MPAARPHLKCGWCELWVSVASVCPGAATAEWVIGGHHPVGIWLAKKGDIFELE
jgi:hypothetical protein